ncbi:hypothetical protein D3C80_949940 [compost metagenome]
MTAQAHIHRPVRLERRLHQAPRARPRPAHARMGIAIARTGHRHVHGEDQPGHPQRHGPLQSVLHEGAVLQHIELKPDGSAAAVHDLLHRTDADGGQDVGNVGRMGRARHLHLAAPRRHAAQTNGGQRHRQGGLLAEQLGLEAQARHVAQHPLAQGDVRQISHIVAQGLLGEGPAVDVVEQEARQTTPGGLAEVSGRGDDHDGSFNWRSASSLSTRSA